MTAPYIPLCEVCRDNDLNAFRLGCSGCQARKALMPPNTDTQVEAMDSTFNSLEGGRYSLPVATEGAKQ